MTFSYHLPPLPDDYDDDTDDDDDDVDGLAPCPAPMSCPSPLLSCLVPSLSRPCPVEGVLELGLATKAQSLGQIRSSVPARSNMRYGRPPYAFGGSWICKLSHSRASAGVPPAKRNRCNSTVSQRRLSSRSEMKRNARATKLPQASSTVTKPASQGIVVSILRLQNQLPPKKNPTQIWAEVCAGKLCAHAPPTQPPSCN